MLKPKILIAFFTSRTIILSCLVVSSLFLSAACQSTTSTSDNYSPELRSDRRVSYQENRITLNSQEIEEPLYLQIITPKNTNLVGKILLEDNKIADLKNGLSLNLSTLLQPGKNIIIISGSYEPKSSSVTIKLQGKNTQSTSSTGGNGTVRQKLIIIVQ